MICSKCGNNLPNGAAFCNLCGTPTVPMQAPVQPMQAPVQPMQAPVQPMQAPVQPMQAPIQPMQAPVQPMQAPVQPMQAPVQPMQAPVQPMQAPVQPMQAPVQPMQAPVSPAGMPGAPMMNGMYPGMMPMKKSKLPLIIGIIVGILVLAGAIIGIIFGVRGCNGKKSASAGSPKACLQNTVRAYETLDDDLMMKQVLPCARQAVAGSVNLAGMDEYYKSLGINDLKVSADATYGEVTYHNDSDSIDRIIDKIYSMYGEKVKVTQYATVDFSLTITYTFTYNGEPYSQSQELVNDLVDVVYVDGQWYMFD